MKIYSFDIGVASIGWAFIENEVLQDCGIRIFTKAENPKNGASLALPRREARGVRKRLARRRGRLNTIKQLLCKEFGLQLEDYLGNDGELPKAYTASKANPLKSPYELRTLALSQKLDSKDLVRVILHIAKHRGYGNKHAKDSKDTESGKVKKAIEFNRKTLAEKGYRSVGEYLYREFFQQSRISQNNGATEFINVRNKAGNYEHCVAQDMLKEELESILNAQRQFGFSLKQDFENKLLTKIFEQRPLKSFADKVGNCCFIAGEKRAPKDSPSAIEFIALSRTINTLINLSKESGELYNRAIILQIVESTLKKGEISYKELREIIRLDERLRFKDPRLDYSREIKEAEKVKFLEFKQLKGFKKALGESFTTLARSQLDEIAEHIALIKDRVKLNEKLESYVLTKEQREALSNLSFSAHINLSLQALKQILPFMRGDNGEQCLDYDESVEKAGLKALSKDTLKGQMLPPLNEFEPYLSNPVVARALAEYRKVLNALLKQYGSPHKIHIEYAREAKLSSTERQKYEKEQKDNYAANQAAHKKCQELGLEPSSTNLLKLKLWQEQGGLCLYSGAKITISYLQDPTALQVDHIYPYSRSFDDSYMNKCLVLTKANQEKGNRTPFEAFGTDSAKWGVITTLAQKLPHKKRRRILNTAFNDKEAGFKLRNLNDTSYIAHLVADYTETYLEFLSLVESEDTTLGKGQKGSKKHIAIVNGALTSTMRYYLGFASKDRDNHLHHALDAVIIGFMNDSVIKAFSDFKKTQETSKAAYYAHTLSKQEYKKQRAFIQLPSGENFRTSVLEKVESVFVSKPPRKRVRGALHEATFYSPNDPKLLKNYGGTKGVERALALGKMRKVGAKIVSNGAMVRVDIFRHKSSGKFYGVPVYTMDFALGILPNKAVVVGKDKNDVIKDWLEMDSSYEFIFSLYKDDLLLVQKKEMVEPELCYFVSFGVSTASIQVAKHDNNFSTLTENQKLLFSNATKEEVVGKSIGIQNLKVFEKWQVSVLGEVKRTQSYPRENISLASKAKK
ncbi:type II CRISPR RNA-guided endonuclease Cas9 [Helicobacter cinaedi]|uniref:type II CRISPR RNA-guided endonuclease Cas9 n=1 Tax=Helicobacter cinaedi TaxID=213 RepID=UPI000CF10ED6|nr:type II CRISPR RNA-guided endonuclease Cas9 [Helicobacter cinaedi]AWK62065.1 type II CRISPR RNA-guided endonuclease Cas9 [Helicobacter cinaedi]QOQ95534.1 type II CRISPR RNA-guided endonuclease Cas9 [Helicobacter cinaedi]